MVLQLFVCLPIFVLLLPLNDLLQTVLPIEDICFAFTQRFGQLVDEGFTGVYRRFCRFEHYVEDVCNQFIATILYGCYTFYFVQCCCFLQPTDYLFFEPYHLRTTFTHPSKSILGEALAGKILSNFTRLEKVLLQGYITVVSVEDDLSADHSSQGF